MSERRAILLAEHEGDTETVRRALGANEPSLRILALGAMLRLDRLAPTDLVNALVDTDRDVRCRAIELAVDRPTLLDDEAVRTMLDDVDDLVVETAAWALGERWAGAADETRAVAAVDSLRRVATEHEESICREAAVAALGAIGAERGLDAILAAMEDKATVRRRAVLALAPFSGPTVAAAVEHALNDRDRQVRQAAEDLIGN